jgi:dipeptidyl aminopeptidase/acylaminoacyl peptidase
MIVPSMRPTSRAFALALLLAACSDTTAPEPRIVEGVDLDALFADPTPDEIAAVSAEWAMRAPAASAVVVERDTVVELGADSLRVRVVSHDVDGVRHYGAVLALDTLTGPAPVIVYAHPGDEGASVDELLFLFPFLGGNASRFVWVVPSFRSEGLTFGADLWESDGPPSPWDRDVDDALSLLDVALALETAADPTSVGVLGFSRGAGVGLLMGIRDPVIDRIVAFFGPTDFFDGFVQDVVADALRGSAPALPGILYLDEAWIQPLRRGEISLAQVRVELVRRSAVLFADRLPEVQIHHGTADPVVDVSQARSLIDAMASLGRGEPEFQAFIYPDGTHNPLGLPGSVTRTVEFLIGLLPQPPTRAPDIGVCFGGACRARGSGS